MEEPAPVTLISAEKNGQSAGSLQNENRQFWRETCQHNPTPGSCSPGFWRIDIWHSGSMKRSDQFRQTSSNSPFTKYRKAPSLGKRL